MLELTGRVPLGVNVRDLFQLQRSLERDGKVDAATHVHGIARVRDAPTDVCELRLEAQHALDELWDPLELGDQSRVLIDIESAAHVSEMQSEQEAARHHRREQRSRGSSHWTAADPSARSRGYWNATRSPDPP